LQWSHAFILVLVAMVVFAALTAFGPLISDVFDNISNTI
jgi:Flp pilus assembly pilin Flp